MKICGPYISPLGTNKALSSLALMVFLMMSACNFGTSIESLAHFPHLVAAPDANEWMQNNKNWRLIEVSKSDKYAQGHLPSAFNLWRPDYSNDTEYPYSGMRSNRAEMETLLSELGMQKDMVLLLYDTQGNVDAARLAWQLELWNFQNFYLIDGGKKAWELASLPLTKETPKQPNKSDFKFTTDRENKALLASQEEVQAAIQDPNTIIIDTREPYEYKGEPFEVDGVVYKYKKGAFASGAIPSSLHYNWSNAVSLHGDHRFKSLKDIIYDLGQLDVKSDKNIIVYCQSGVRSAHTSFVLRHLLNYPSVQNYDGSWIEWSYLNIKNQNANTIRTIEQSKIN